jgi:hypothetical protein
MFNLLCFCFDSGHLLECRVPPATSKSVENASCQEVFGSKGKDVLVEKSSAVSTADVTSSAIRAGVTAASTTEKAGTSTAPPAGG